MANIEEFESWVKTKGGQKGLAEAFSKRFPKEKPISQAAISNWVTRRAIPLERRPQIKAMGWAGPWDWPPDPEAILMPDAVSRVEFAEYRGKVDEKLSTLKDGLEKALELIRDLSQRLPPESRPKGH